MSTNNQTMRGVVLPGNRQLETRDYPIPLPSYGQVVLQMKASDLCGSDLRAIWRSYLIAHLLPVAPSALSKILSRLP